MHNCNYWFQKIKNSYDLENLYKNPLTLNVHISKLVLWHMSNFSTTYFFFFSHIWEFVQNPWGRCKVQDQAFFKTIVKHCLLAKNILSVLYWLIYLQYTISCIANILFNRFVTYLQYEILCIANILSNLFAIHNRVRRRQYICNIKYSISNTIYLEKMFSKNCLYYIV